MENIQNMPRVLEIVPKKDLDVKENNQKGDFSLFFYV